MSNLVVGRIVTRGGTWYSAQSQMHSWKTSQVTLAAKELLMAGVDLYDKGVIYFAPDDVPPCVSFEGNGIMGCAVHMLLDSTVIVENFDTYPELGIYHGRRHSKRASAHGRKVSLYSLVSRPIAQEWLKRHGVNVESKRQMELGV
jgi:hypothetical protein